MRGRCILCDKSSLEVAKMCSFPRNFERAKVWFDALHFGIQNDWQNLRLCIDHFDSSMYDLTKKLYRTAVPTPLNETVISRASINENNEKPQDTEYKQGSVQDYISIRNKIINDLTVVVQKTCTDDKVYLSETLISGGYIKQEPCSMKDGQGSMQNYLSTQDENTEHKKEYVNKNVISRAYDKQEPCYTEKEQGSTHSSLDTRNENLDDLTVVTQETEFMADMDDKVCIHETIISGGYIKQEPCGMKDQQGSMQDYLSTKDKNIEYNRECVNENVISAAYDKREPCYTEKKQGSTHSYLDIRNENVDDLIVVAQETELMAYEMDNKVCVHETIISGGYIKQEPCGMRDQQGSIQNYLSILSENIEYNKEYVNEGVISGAYDKQELCYTEKEQGSTHSYLDTRNENVDDLTVVTGETELMTDGMDDKVCVYDTVISRGYTKEEPCDMGYESRSIHNNLRIKACEECGEEYDLYCLKCPMLVRIFDSNNPDRINNTARWTLPKHFIDIRETPFSVGVVALRIIPKGVVFGPFKGLDSTKDDTVSKWKLRNKELDYPEDRRQLNWMRFIRMADHRSHQNLMPFQYEHELYYRSKCHINVGHELLVRWDSDGKECEIQDIENSYWKPRICERLDDSYACTLCCVGYKSMSHLKTHNSTCIEKRNKQDFSGEIVQCDVCKIYLDEKEYSDYHMDRCYKSNGKWKCGRPRRHRIHNGDKPFSCTLCPYKATTSSTLKRHIALHNGDRPFSCTLCSYKATRKSDLRQHLTVHNDDKPFACTLCPYTARRKSMLKQHAIFHNDDRPFACTLCTYKAKKATVLKQHLAVHNDDKPFACTLCPYKTKTKEMLNEHVATHNGDKPFGCTLCEYQTTVRSNLKRHMVIHNGGKPFACTFCPYKTTKKSILNKHVATHNGDKSFGCTLCPYKAKTTTGLKQHVAHHNE